MSAPLVDAASRRMSDWEHLALSDTADDRMAAAFGVPPAYLLRAVHSTDDAQRAHLRALLRDPMRSPSAMLSHRFTRWLLRRNQFLPIDARTLRRIRDTYDLGFARVLRLREHPSSQEVGMILEHHGRSLRSVVTEITGGRPRDAVSAEYRPQTQLSVLGLTVESLRGPVLDIGSGEHALLVRFLRSSGFETHGIDRLGHGEMQADWLSYEPGRRRWATIIAHHSFTLHFWHHHRRAGATDTVRAYAEAFMRYLFALEEGGTFAYAPGLPFIERALPPDRWLVRPIARRLDGVRTSASHITRRY